MGYLMIWKGLSNLLKNQNEEFKSPGQTEAQKLLTQSMYEKNLKKKEEILLKCLKLSQNNPIDLHYTYNHLIDLYYKQRETRSDALKLCIYYCLKDIELFPKFKKASIEQDFVIKRKLQRLFAHDKSEFKRYEKEIKEYKWNPPQIPSFKRLAIIYEKMGKYEEAISVCEKAIRYGLTDGTKIGFEGRIEKIKKKMKN